MSEFWDAYNNKEELIKDKVLERGKPIEKGIYHLMVHIIVKHIDGTILMVQRDGHKRYPFKWETGAAGSSIKGETPLNTAKRELKEETGLESDKFILLDHHIEEDRQGIYYIYGIIYKGNKDDVILNPNETIAYKWLELNELDKSELAVPRTLPFLNF